MPEPYRVIAFYKFTPLSVEELPSLQKNLQDQGKDLDLSGLLLVAPEGINGTVAGRAQSIECMKQFLEQKFGDLMFKDSASDSKPFKRYKVDLRTEIVSLGKPSIKPEGTEKNYLTPKEWNTLMDREDVVILDTRNTYETAIGKFKNALDPGMERFSEFPDFVEKCDIPKDKKVLMYCTGGIRCEKASLEMKRQGYEHVYQLQGGILGYFAESPVKHFEGECFVFDHRVAVDHTLEPSVRYTLCPHCGDPGDQRLSCLVCGTDAVICEACSVKEERKTCSLNCQYHASKAKKSESETKN